MFDDIGMIAFGTGTAALGAAGAVLFDKLKRFFDDEPLLMVGALPPEERQLVYRRTSGTMCSPDGAPLTLSHFRKLMAEDRADRRSMRECLIADLETEHVLQEALLAELRTKILQQKVKETDNEND